MKTIKKSTNTLENFVQELFHTDKKLPFETCFMKYKKNSVFLGPGQIEDNIYFVSSGIVQSSLMTSTNREKIYGFAFSGELFCSLLSFITRQPTDLTFTCLTDCVLEIIPRENFNKAIEESMLAIKFMKYFYEHIYVMRVEKERDLLKLTGKERYFKLMKNNPEIIKQLPVGKIAKYIGMHPRSLSRIRKF